MFLIVILIAGTFAAIYPSFIMGVEAQGYPYYQLDNRYNIYEQETEYPSYQPDYKPIYPSYEKDNKYKSKKDDNKSVSLNKLNCINNNVNINGNNTGDINVGNNGQVAPPLPTARGEYLNDDMYSGEEYSEYNNKHIKEDKNFECIINNNNNNTVVIEEPPIPPTPPEPPITSLTVNKEIFGCNNIIFNPIANFSLMDCRTLQADDPRWISCDDPLISNTIACQFLTEDFFDIEVLDDQDNQIAQFEGSVEGETIENLEPGTYTVNEIAYNTSGPNVFRSSTIVTAQCVSLGFDGGGLANFLNNEGTGTVVYTICFEYEDEQGNDCRNITLAAGEEKTCTVKNYINMAIAQGSFTIAQGIGDSPKLTALENQQPNDSPELTATEKITKLKTQWLELLP